MIPIQITVTRYVCPFCRRGRSTGKAAVAHIARCWRNPAARACKTCKHYDAGVLAGYEDPPMPEECEAGVDIDDGLIVACESWEAK